MKHSPNRTIKTIGSALLMVGLLASPFGALAQGNSAGGRPVVHGLTAPTVLAVSEEGTWKVNASDPNDEALTYAVDWGENQSVGALRSNEAEFVQTATFTHSYETPGVYPVSFMVKNTSGLTARMSATVMVKENPTENPLIISDAEAAAVDPHTAKISWKTNLHSDSRVWMSTSTPVDTSIDPNVHRRAQVLNHHILLRDLSPETTYYLVVGSENRRGHAAASSEISFTTPQLPSEDPSIVSIEGPTSTSVDVDNTWTVNASDPMNGALSYSVDWGDAPESLVRTSESGEVFVQTATFTHAYAEAGTYVITFTVMNEAGLTATETTSVEVSANGEEEEEEDTLSQAADEQTLSADSGKSGTVRSNGSVASRISWFSNWFNNRNDQNGSRFAWQPWTFWTSWAR